MTHQPYTIDLVARRFGVSLRTLRFYEQKGLVVPMREGNRRLYSERNCTQIAVILKGKKLGFSLAEIEALMAANLTQEAKRGVELIEDFSSVMTADQFAASNQ